MSHYVRTDFHWFTQVVVLFTRILFDHAVNISLFFFSDLFYGGEATTAEQPQAYSCPYCSKMGFTETLLQEHVTTEHADTSVEVVSN